ncbi:pentatricopeptide repeat-containing protein At5g09450, mitochondrial isoform X2 [Vitis riparia]|uniref:pentatricopeptide repeat-containing protein At5g09450, mitochondrial isoform X2 n=1 Tax=Vitis riparia TaxID=96939 RepID=UPI00155AD2B6|nr:pentatricopeptide repeat-containing protein At5g09450, mitochondrial isoform X2 [Vitis riparia]
MGTRSLFLGLTRQCISEKFAFRLLSSRTLRSEVLEESPNSPENDDLKSRIFKLRLPKRSATNVLQRWVGEGNQVHISELRNISKELRRAQRYKHALEISEWMVSHDEFELSDSDNAVRIDLMTRVFGIDAAERYFEGLPSAAKTSETYTALLHSYAGAKLTEKAEELYERIKESNVPLNILLYNEMMTLYMSVGQVEKVSLVVEELKRQKVVPDLFTYNLWVSSCAATLDIDGVRRILKEMSNNSSANDGWVRYRNLANIYIMAGRLVNSASNSVVEAGTNTTQRDWITYDFLIILYAGLGNKDKIDQIWKSLKMTKQKIKSRSYVCILSSYVMLGHIRDVGIVIDEWKKSTTTDFDISAFYRLLDAFAELRLIEEAETFHKLLIRKSCLPTDESR